MNLVTTEPVKQSVDVDSVKSNVVDLTTPVRGVHINQDGVIAGVLFDDPNGTNRSFTVKAGMYYPYCFKRILNAATTTTGAIGLI